MLVKTYSCFAHEIAQNSSHHAQALFGRSRPDVNRYLKWAFVEAANAICVTRRRSSSRHVSRLYNRIARRKGHPKAIGALARHLAEATF